MVYNVIIFKFQGYSIKVNIITMTAAVALWTSARLRSKRCGLDSLLVSDNTGSPKDQDNATTRIPCVCWVFIIITEEIKRLY